jgi:hypothetical protein
MGGMSGPGGANHNAKRNIPADHDFDKKAIKPIVNTLWAMSVALGHALTAHRQFSRLKSSTFSPDGLLGGRGYVMPIKEIRQQIFEACENLSALVDTLHDEINAPHWKPKLADLEKADMAEVERLLTDAEEWVDNPEEETEEELSDVSHSGNSEWTKDRFKENNGQEPRSDMPGGGDKETLQKSGPHPASPDHPNQKKQASAGGYDRRSAGEREQARRTAYIIEQGGPIDLHTEHPIPVLPKELRDLRGLYARFYEGNSSVDPGTLPGPRVDHLDRADVDQTGPGGSVNRDDPAVDDQWGETDGVSGEPMSQNTGDGYNYPSAWDGNSNNSITASYDRTARPEEGAHGVYNPHAIMPGDPGAPLGDRTKQDHYETVEDVEPTKGAETYSREGASGVPDSSSDSTPGQAFDFGIGDGNGNDAHGQAAGGYGTANPGSPDSNPDSGVGNRGVFGPQAELPDDPGGSTRDRENDGTNEKVEQGIGNNSVPAQKAATYKYGRTAAGKIPNDDEDPVARSDYYWGDKGNDFNTDYGKAASPAEAQSRTPGNNAPQPEAPLKSRPEHLQSWEFSALTEPVATSETPGDDSPEGTHDSEPGYGVDEFHRVEQDSQPYVKFDDDTHNMQPDNTYQRGDLPSPYVNQTTP